MQVEAYAKINWSLRITGKRADGFHDLETLFQTISLHDTLTFRESDCLTLTCDDPSIPTDETNLVLRAARALGAPPVAIELQKRIPAGGGLGGGSSNAAATLVTLSRMFGIDADLESLALSLGSDVPFFLVGGTAYATGRGEVLTPVAPLADTPLPLLLLLPDERVLTRDAFARITRYSEPIGRDDHASFADFTNDFEEPVFALLPRLRALKTRLLDAGATWAQMSGSGSTMVGAFADANARDEAAARFDDVRAVRAETVDARGVLPASPR
ncbi:MAG: 4-(cytidine 5'-diphospho)-2-C-methyl-D-erythritol kinase [Acidobacteria bacterium]|nr:4-(cytidine 5'-diphospho)-2-C-methyl-D-erythritol kinase [Acidobacteriota bacterium]MBV9476558.1 4-(cytidine 5'-diphospho)-2-C-methyl-D-erythritol kinase [Acidobacteriota bacterium]